MDTTSGGVEYFASYYGVNGGGDDYPAQQAPHFVSGVFYMNAAVGTILYDMPLGQTRPYWEATEAFEISYQYLGGASCPGVP